MKSLKRYTRRCVVREFSHNCLKSHGRSVILEHMIPRPEDTKFKILLAVQTVRLGSRVGPTVEELREMVGLSSRSSVQYHINALVAEGFLSQVPGKRRTLRTTQKGDLLVGIFAEEQDA